jgi:hypothetical protein
VVTELASHDDVRAAVAILLRRSATELVLAVRVARIHWTPPPQLLEWAVALVDLAHDLDSLAPDQEAH